MIFKKDFKTTLEEESITKEKCISYKQIKEYDLFVWANKIELKNMNNSNYNSL